MKVSIITPSYNQAKYLELTIRSVLDQGYKDLEYMIIDGGSSDGSIDLIHRYKDHLSYWVSEPDRGQAEAINKGFFRATGDIIAWLNSDDIYAPGAISSAVKVFLQYPEVGMVYGNAISIDEDNIPFNKQVFKQYQLKDLVAFHIICQPAVFIRRECLEDAGYLDDHYHFLLDHHLWLRIAQFSEIHYVPEFWAFARYHPEAKNIAQASEFADEANKILEWMKGDAKLAKIIAENDNEVMAMYHRFVGRYLLDGNKPWLAFKSYARSFRSMPTIALQEWHRILFAVLSILGMDALGRVYYQRKRNKISFSHNNRVIPYIEKFS